MISNNRFDFERLDKEIRSHISSKNDVVIAVDNTGGHYSEPLVYFLQSNGYSVYYLETKAIKGARERLLDQPNKSDVIDCICIAYLLFLIDCHGISFRISAIKYDLMSEAAILKFLISQRWMYTKTATQAVNRLHQFLLATFPEGEARYFRQLVRITGQYPLPTDIVASNGLVGIKHLRKRDRENIIELAANTVGVSNSAYGLLIKDLSLQYRELIAKQESISEEIRLRVRSHPYGEVLLSFPYLGELTAATIISIIKDIDRWPNKKKFRKALGVYGTISLSSGKTSRRKRGREGSRIGRRALFQVCFGCIRENSQDNYFRDYYRRHVEQQGIRMKALFNTMGKLAEIIYHCLKKRELYSYNQR